MQDVQTAFKKRFGYAAPYVASAPSGIELLGNAVTSGDGLAMSVALDRYIHIAAAPRTDGKIELVSTAFAATDLFWISRIEKNSAAPWTDHFKGVLLQLRKRGVHFSGFNAAVHGTIPAGAGMNSSAALATAAALIVRKLFPFSLTETGATIPPKRNERGGLPPLAAPERLYFARLCCAAEREFIGAHASVSDCVACLYGKPWNVMLTDSRFNSVQHVLLAGEAVIICRPRENENSVLVEQRQLQTFAASAAMKLGAKSLRAVESKDLQAGKERLEPGEYACARHVVSETARVVAAERALREDDHRQFGQYMFQSHESAVELSAAVGLSPDGGAERLIDLARKIPGCLGARRTGGGFGGATVNLVAYHQAQGFVETIAREFRQKTGRDPEVFVCPIVGGAG